MVGNSKYNSFICVKGRAWLKIDSWKNNFLSQVENEVLIETIPQAIPTLTMGVFKLLRTLC